MDREQEVIHHQMEETRAGLANKLSALESSVGGTVQAATNAVETTKDAVTGTVEAVTGTVESVKETVETVTEKVQETVAGVTDTVQEAVAGVTDSVKETFQSVAETFNVKLQCERHPWAVFGGSVAVGALAGFLLGGSRSRRYRRNTDEMRRGQPEPSAAHESMLGSAASAVGNVASTLGHVAGGAAGVAGKAASGAGGLLGGWLGEQLSGLKGLAVGAIMGVVRDVAKQALPENLKARVAEEVDRFTRNLGGEPIKGSLLPEDNDASEPAHHNGHGEQRQGQQEMAGSRY